MPWCGEPFLDLVLCNRTGQLSRLQGKRHDYFWHFTLSHTCHDTWQTFDEHRARDAKNINSRWIYATAFIPIWIDCVLVCLCRSVHLRWQTSTRHRTFRRTWVCSAFPTKTDSKWKNKIVESTKSHNLCKAHEFRISRFAASTHTR